MSCRGYYSLYTSQNRLLRRTTKYNFFLIKQKIRTIAGYHNIFIKKLLSCFLLSVNETLNGFFSFKEPGKKIKTYNSFFAEEKTNPKEEKNQWYEKREKETNGNEKQNL